MRSLRPMTFAALAMTSATPLLAQEMCGGLGTGGTWIGGNETASDITTTTDIQEQMALVLGGNAYVSLFTLSDSTDVRVEAEGRGAGDPQLDLFDSTGAIITSDDDSGGGGAARAELPLEAGTYCLAVRSYDGSPMTSFVRVTRTDQEALTEGLTETPENTDTAVPAAGPQGSCDDARPMTGTLVDGLLGLGSVNDTGFWRFTLDAPTAVTIKAENEEADPVLTVIAADGATIAENDDFDGLNAQIDFDNPLPAGDYCLAVTAVNDNALEITTTVTTYDPNAALRLQIEGGDVAPPLDGSYAITDLGTLDNRQRHDMNATAEVQWFQIAMPAAGLLLIEAVAVTESVDPWMVVFDDLGRKVGQNDDYGDGYNSLIASRVPAGLYLIGIKQLEDEGSGPIRVVLERYTAAQ